VISRDNVSVKVNAVVFFRVVDPAKAIIQVENFLMATSQLAQTTLRVVLGKHELDEMLAERERLNLDVQQILDAQTDAWGIKVTNVEIKHIDLNETMVRAIARQAEAERERRAKVIHAEGEKQAAVLAAGSGGHHVAGPRSPRPMQLRYLQTMTQVAGDRASTIVLSCGRLPLPMDAAGPEPRRAQARGLRLGDVRLRQLGLHHGGADGGVQRLLRGRGGRRRPGHAGLDRDAGLSSLLVMLTMPAWAPGRPACGQEAAAGASAPWAACSPPRAGLGGPGRPAGWRWWPSCCRTSSTAYGESLIAAFLPELARREAWGRVSGWGWSFGYFGGMLTLGLSLGYVLWAQGAGPCRPPQFVPVTMLITPASMRWPRWPPSRC
jgi:hypothetical protein